MIVDREDILVEVEPCLPLLLYHRLRQDSDERVLGACSHPDKVSGRALGLGVEGRPKRLELDKQGFRGKRGERSKS